MTINLATGSDLALRDEQNVGRDQRLHVLEQTASTISQKLEQLIAITTRIEATMASQADVDALTTAVSQIATDLEADFTKIQAELDSLAAGGVNVSALQAAIAPLDARVQALGALQPTPPPAP